MNYLYLVLILATLSHTQAYSISWFSNCPTTPVIPDFNTQQVRAFYSFRINFSVILILINCKSSIPDYGTKSKDSPRGSRLRLNVSQPHMDL